MHTQPSAALRPSAFGVAGVLTLGALTLGTLALAGFSSGCAAAPTPATSASAGSTSASSTREGSTPKEYAVDRTTTAKVESALDSDPALTSFEFNVETVDGSVELNGYVDRPEQRAAAGRDAAGVAGVTSVQNDIVVRQLPGDQRPAPVSKGGPVP